MELSPSNKGEPGVTSIESLKTSLSLETKEDVSNKSTDTSLGTSEELYPTQNAVKSYVDLATNQATTDARYLTLSGGSMSGDIAMGANDISGAGTVSATTFAGDLNGTINTATTATTQSVGDNSTKVATTAYADAALALKLDLAGGSMSGDIAMGANDISGAGTVSATTFSGDLSGTINTATTATTQSAGDNSTKVATTAYADAALALKVPYTGATGTVDFGAYDLTVNGVLVGKGGVTGNTRIGASALTRNSIGVHNTAVGFGAISTATTAGNNTGVGYLALFLTTGGDNTAIGNEAGFLNVTGSQNTYIGSKTGSSPNNLTNTTAIGYSASATTSNSIILGNSSIATLRCQVNSISSLSDGRDKTDILTLSEGLDFIKQLKPVTFTWNTRDKAKVGIKSAGFIAQDLLALQQNSTIGANLDLVSFENPDKLEARYANLLPIMVKAIQEETDLRVKEMEVKDQEITDLKERLSSLEDLVNQLLAEQQK
jgi:trimeric autotransporter adhesin